MKGFLRHVLVKRGFKTNEIMVVLVTGVINFPSKNAFIKELLKLHPEITTIVQNVNNKFTSMMLFYLSSFCISFHNLTFYL